MCKDLQENKINNMKFHDEIDQFIELFKGQIIGQNFQYVLNTTRKNAIVEYLDYKIPVTQLMGNGDMQAAKRDYNAPPTLDLNIWLCGW